MWDELTAKHFLGGYINPLLRHLSTPDITISRQQAFETVLCWLNILKQHLFVH